MYLLDFVNAVRDAQGYPAIDELPPVDPGADSPLEPAMGCRIEDGVMRMHSPEQAAAIARATGLPVGADPDTLVLPIPLEPHSSAVPISLTTLFEDDRAI